MQVLPFGTGGSGGLASVPGARVISTVSVAKGGWGSSIN